MRFPKTFPGMLFSSALPETRFLDALLKDAKRGRPFRDIPFCYSVTARRPDASVRITKETDNRGETRDTF